jgi:hypothetical protein
MPSLPWAFCSRRERRRQWRPEAFIRGQQVTINSPPGPLLAIDRWAGLFKAMDATSPWTPVSSSLPTKQIHLLEPIARPVGNLRGDRNRGYHTQPAALPGKR